MILKLLVNVGTFNGEAVQGEICHGLEADGGKPRPTDLAFLCERFWVWPRGLWPEVSPRGDGRSGRRKFHLDKRPFGVYIVMCVNPSVSCPRRKPAFAIASRPVAILRPNLWIQGCG